MIDFDFASPGPRLWDLAYLAYRIIPLSTDHADGFSGEERETRLDRLLQTYGMSASRDEMLVMVVGRLEHLADFSDEMANHTGNPALDGHAAFYRADAEYIRRELITFPALR